MKNLIGPYAMLTVPRFAIIDQRTRAEMRDATKRRPHRMGETCKSCTVCRELRATLAHAGRQ